MTNRTKGILKLGDAEGPVLIHVQPKSRHRDFAMIELHGTINLVKTDKLSGTELRILLLMICKMDYDNICSLSQRQIAEELGCDPVLVSRCLKTLKAVGAVKPKARVGSVIFFMVSPYIATKSKHGKVLEVVRHWEAEVKA